VLQSTLLRAFT